MLMKEEQLKSYIAKRFNDSKRRYEELLESDSCTNADLTIALLEMIDNRNALDALMSDGI